MFFFDPKKCRFLTKSQKNPIGVFGGKMGSGPLPDPGQPAKTRFFKGRLAWKNAEIENRGFQKIGFQNF